MDAQHYLHNVMSCISRIEVLILKPLSILHLCVALFCLFNRAWVIAGWMILAWFIIGAIGASLHPEKTALELSRGTIDQDWAASAMLSHSELFELSKMN